MIFDDGIFDEDLIEDYLFRYTLDAIVQAVNQPKSYNVDALLGDVHRIEYRLGGTVQKIPQTSYLIDALLALEKSDPRFQESIINAIIKSYARRIAELKAAISTMGLRLQLPYAVPEDLDLYWSRVLGLPRRYGEADEDYRSRLMTRLSIMKSSGTKAECEAILNSILGMKGAVDLVTYWPAEVRVNWTSYNAMRTAEARYSAVKEALDTMIAAGVSWSTSFPYKTYDVDAYLMGRHSTSYSVDTGISKEKSCLYLVRTDIFDIGSISQDLDAFLETVHSILELVDVRIKADRSKSELIDANIEKPRIETYQVDGILLQKSEKSYEVDAISEKLQSDVYDVDAFASMKRRSSYLITAEVSA